MARDVRVVVVGGEVGGMALVEIAQDNAEIAVPGPCSGAGLHPPDTVRNSPDISWTKVPDDMNQEAHVKRRKSGIGWQHHISIPISDVDPP